MAHIYQWMTPVNTLDLWSWLPSTIHLHTILSVVITSVHFFMLNPSCFLGTHLFWSEYILFSILHIYCICRAIKGWSRRPCHQCVGQRAACGSWHSRIWNQIQAWWQVLWPSPSELHQAPILFKNYFYFMCMDVVFAYLCAMCARCPRRPEEALDPLKQQLQVLMSCDVSTGSWTQVLRKGRQFSSPAPWYSL